MSVSLTEPQVVARAKTVTRRVGWRMLRAGDQITLFVAFFCRAHRDCRPETEVTRIEWRYLEP
ncbi:hypothetical protein IU452_14815 [Nocardia transvalensis]|nr:hypothetical protein [Nocardia transvalensis]